MTATDTSYRIEFENAVRTLEAQVASVGVHLSLDSLTRVAYTRKLNEMTADLRRQAINGKITWRQATEQASRARNIIMDSMRWRSSPVGRAMAQNMKSQGRTLNEIIARTTQKLYGQNTNFNRLTEVQKNHVYSQIVRSAGKSNPRVNAHIQTMSHAGRGLILFSLALTAYTVMTADDKAGAFKREAAVTGGGVAGGFAGGAIAGLACGPGAPACVTIGAFAGGALTAFGVATFW